MMFPHDAIYKIDDLLKWLQNETNQPTITSILIRDDSPLLAHCDLS